ncbi:MAG: phosphoribosylformylglycinamidine synthase subunit PurL [Planctomycetota bacterium]
MSQINRIEIAAENASYDSAGKEVLEDFHHFGLSDVESVRSVRVFTFGGTDSDSAEKIAHEFLSDAVVDKFSVDKDVIAAPEAVVVEVSRRTGVMDPVEGSVLKAVRLMGISADWVRTSNKYLIYGKVSEEEVKAAGEKLLANDVIEEITVGKNAPHDVSKGADFKFEKIEIDLTGLSDAELEKLSTDKQLYLSLPEMQCVRDYFAAQGRIPTDIELETIAQTWSEHCVHKTLKGKVRYKGPEGEEFIDNILKSTIAKVTTELDKEWCLSVFVDNAGVIEFDDEFGAAFKVETHNHPSALEPYGGAGTGIGGVIRDCLGTGLGAKPVMNTDIFCFGPPDFPREDVPKGALHPMRVLKGVVGGVRDYGNRMGIPTANGAVYFDKRYIGNPLVFCGTVGVIPRSMVEKEAHPGQCVVVVGGRTGRDGIHGATFSSVELDEDSEMASSGAVQIGNPIEEKKVRDFQLRARDAGLYSCVTDCGAGGLSSAVGEMGEELGVEVDLEKVPLKYDGLSYTEIWISEAQERMVYAADEEKLAELQKLADEEDVEMTVIGRFTDDKMLHLKYNGVSVGDIEMDFLHNGVPQIEREAVWEEPKSVEPALAVKDNYNEELKRILGAWNVCSKEWIIRQYDHEVQGGSVIKPLVGVENDGPGDAAVISPILGSQKGLVLSVGVNPKYSDIDPYWMAASAIDEAVRNVIAVGGSLERCAVLDNYCWGNCDKPDRLGGLVRASKACYEIGKYYGLPFISGKDSLNNEFATANGTVSIPGTLLISAMAVMEDVTKALSMDLKEAGNSLYVVGKTYDELGASHYYELYNELGRNVPVVRKEDALATFKALSSATDKRLVRAMHDLSEGGLAVAAAEMAFAGGLGLEVDLGSVPVEGNLSADKVLFSESNSRFLAEVSVEKQADFEKELTAEGVSFAKIGEVTSGHSLVVKSDNNILIDNCINDLKKAWQKPLAL